MTATRRHRAQANDDATALCRCGAVWGAAIHDRDRTPHRGDPILLYGDRRTVLDLIRRDEALVVVADDDAGLRIERYADRLAWDDDARAWRAVA